MAVPRRAPTRAAPAPGGSGAALLRRCWAAPLAAHVGALAVVLLVGLWLSAPGVAFTSDEGAALVQARVLDDTGDWIYRYPLAGIDAEDEARPFLRGDLGTEGLAPYARHPLYPLVLAGSDRVGGSTGIALTSVAGTLVAALCAGLIARRFGPSLDRWALWVCGVGSPLFFDAYLVLGHAPAAAAAGLAVLAAVKALERERTASAVWPLLGLALAVAVATALRTEGAFVGPAIALGVAVASWRRAVPVATAAAVAVIASASTAIVLVAERLALAAIIGSELPTVSEGDPSSWIGGRLEGLVATWLDPSYSDDRGILVVLSLAAIFVAFTAIVVRWAPSASRLVVTGAVAAVACYAARLFVDPPGAIPGLLVAFPVGWAGLWLLGRRAVATPVTRLVSVAAAAIVAAVALTQYARGGGLEWGGRYFAVALPLAVPPLVGALAHAGRRLDERTARVAVAAAVAATILVAALALRTLRFVHTETDAVLDAMAVAGATAETGNPPELDRPVVVSWNRLLPQIAHRDFDDYEWVVPSRSLVPEYLDRLAGLGVERVVFVTPDSTRDLPELAGWRVVERGDPGLAQEVLVLEREGS